MAASPILRRLLRVAASRASADSTNSSNWKRWPVWRSSQLAAPLALCTGASASGAPGACGLLKASAGASAVFSGESPRCAGTDRRPELTSACANGHCPASDSTALRKSLDTALLGVMKSVLRLLFCRFSSAAATRSWL